MATPAPIEPVREFDLVPPDNTRLANLVGPLDENLRLIEDRMAVTVKRRGANFRITGARSHAAEDVVKDLFEATRHEDVSLERVHLALRDSRDMPGSLGAHEPDDGGSVRVAPRHDPRARQEPARLSREYPQQGPVFRHRAGGHWQDISGRGLCGRGPAGRQDPPHHSRETGGRSG